MHGSLHTGSPSRSREVTPTGTPRERADSTGSRSESETGDGSEDDKVESDDSLTIDDFTAQTIAVELTRKEQRLFAAIPQSEFLEKLGFSAASGVNDGDKTPFISSYVEHFNNVSFWVATDVLMGITPKQQAKKITKFIAVAVHLANLNNFNGLMEIIAGLNFSSVKRLDAWSKVSGKDRKVFEKLAARMALQNNYKAYRHLLQSVNGPKLPYFAVITRDLMFVQVGNRDYLEGSGLINFEKILLVNDVLADIRQWQKESGEYRFKINEKRGKKIKQFMKRLNSIQDEGVLHFLSSLHENEATKKSPDANVQSERRSARSNSDAPPPPQHQQASESTSDPSEEMSETDVSELVSLDDYDYDYDDDDDLTDSHPSPRTSTSSSSSITVLSETFEEIEFIEAEERQASAVTGGVEEAGDPVDSSSGKPVARQRSSSVESDVRSRVQPVPQRKGIANTEIYGSLRYSRKHAEAAYSPMDGCADAISIVLPPADDSNFLSRVIARRRDPKKSIAQQQQPPEGTLEGQTLQLRMKQLSFVGEEAKTAPPGGISPRALAVTTGAEASPLHRSADDRLMQRRRGAAAREKRTSGDATSLLAASFGDSPASVGGAHRKRGSSWTGKQKDNESNEEDEEKEKGKKRMGSLRILSPRRTTNTRVVGTTKAPVSPRGSERSLAGLAFPSPIVTPKNRESQDQPSSSSSNVSSSSSSSSSSNVSSSASPLTSTDNSSRSSRDKRVRSVSAAAATEIAAASARGADDENSWGDLEDGGDEEWESKEGTESACESTKVVIKSYWKNRASASAEAEGQPRANKVCLTAIDAELKSNLASFMKLLSQQHGVTHEGDYASSFSYIVKESDTKMTVNDELGFQEFLTKGVKQYRSVSRQGTRNLSTYIVWLA